MKVEKVNVLLRDYWKIKKLLETSFPENERIPMWRLSLLSFFKDVKFMAFYEDNILCGFIYIIETGTVIFLLYLAVNEQIRSKGYGSRILHWLRTTAPQKEIILNVEIPDEATANNEQRIKRIAFYERNGFVVTEWRLLVYEEQYYLLSSKEAIDIPSFNRILEKYHIGKVHKI